MELPTFDELRDLAQQDPKRFERLRANLIEEFISQSPNHLRDQLRGQQFVIDSRRQIAASPMKALLDIQKMMKDSAVDLQQSWLSGHHGHAQSFPSGARILPFERPPSDVDG